MHPVKLKIYSLKEQLVKFAGRVFHWKMEKPLIIYHTSIEYMGSEYIFGPNGVEKGKIVRHIFKLNKIIFHNFRMN